MTEDLSLLYPEDGRREADIGATLRMPLLKNALFDWEQQIKHDFPIDVAVQLRNIRMAPDGLLTSNEGALVYADSEQKHPMTYRVFGNLLRKYCAPPRNVARCLQRLSISALSMSSPRALAFNDYFRQAVELGAGNEEVILRLRTLQIAPMQVAKVVVGAVTPHHSLKEGDDQVFIEAIRDQFDGHLEEVRARVFRGVEVSELRAVLPALRVEMAPGEWWSGYLVVRNSEVGASSWSVHVGLRKELAGEVADAAMRLGSGSANSATLSFETNSRVGVHTGKRIRNRISDALSEGKSMLRMLMTETRRLGADQSAQTDDWVRLRLATAVNSLGASQELSERLVAGAIFLTPENGTFTAREVVAFLGDAMNQLKYRSQSYPLERLAGRVLLNGVDRGLHKLPEYQDVEAEE